MNRAIPENPRFAKEAVMKRVKLKETAADIFFLNKCSLIYSLNTDVREIAVVKQARKTAKAATIPPVEPKIFAAMACRRSSGAIVWLAGKL